MHRLRSRSARAPRGVALATIALAVVAMVAGACLPASIRSTPAAVATPAPSPTVPPATPTPTPGPPTPTPGPSFAIYTVKRGDTLTRIARKFKTDGRSIAYWNRDQYPSLDPEARNYSPDSLQLGWKLKILIGEKYSPPPDDGETTERVTPEPTDDFETGSPSASDGETAAP